MSTAQNINRNVTQNVTRSVEQTAPQAAGIARAANLPDAGPSILCTSCASPLIAITASVPAFACLGCGTVTSHRAGIWRSLSPDQTAQFQNFIREYEFIRAAESRGSNGPEYYLALPFADLTGRLAEQWRIRARTFRSLERHVIAPLTARLTRPLRILDLGAGNGWMSYRLALLGHQPVAVDILTNDSDGLGAADHYAGHLPVMFPRVQASLDRLPFVDGAFDLAIFNASFHYAADYSETLAEALRCTSRHGAAVIADTPWYRSERIGMQMVREKHDHFRALYGFASNSLNSLEFLTPERLSRLALALDLEWSTYKPFYGFRWALRPLRAKLRGRRTPSHFRLFVAQVHA